jgi:hypothetical protein
LLVDGNGFFSGEVLAADDLPDAGSLVDLAGTLDFEEAADAVGLFPVDDFVVAINFFSTEDSAFLRAAGVDCLPEEVSVFMGVSRVTATGGLSVRKPWNTAWRT